MYTQGFREAAVKLYEHCQSMKKVSTSLGISLSTIWNWIRNGIDVKKRSPTPLPSKVIELIHSTIEKRPWVVQSDLQSLLKQELGVLLSRQCISSVLRKLKMTRKRLKFRGNADPERIHRRILEFKTSYLSWKRSCNNQKVFAVDECGFDFKCLPTHGYSRMGTKPIVNSKSCSNRTRVSLVMGICSEGTFVCDFVEGTTNASTFSTFLSNPMVSGSIILMDNCSIHKTKLVKDKMSLMNLEPLYIPPYTPECNPIENVFAVIKNRFRKQLIGSLGNTKSY